MTEHAGAGPDLTMYTELIDGFLGGSVRADRFSTEYIARQKSDHRLLTDPWYRILTDLFIACDDHVADPALRTDPHDLDDEQLLDAARTARTRLAVLGV